MNDEEKKNLMTETKATQAEIDAHKPTKTIKFISFLLTLILFGAVIVPVTFIYYANKAEDERIAEEERKVQEEIKHKEEKETKEEEPTFNPNLEVEIASYTEAGDFIIITNGDDKLENITAKDEKVTFQVNVTHQDEKEDLQVLMNDKEIFTSSSNMQGVRFFKYKDVYVFELAKMGSQLTNYDSYLYDVSGNEIGKLVNTTYIGYEKEFTDDTIIVKASNSIFDGECQSTKDNNHTAEKTVSKYRLSGTSLTKYEIKTEYCAS